MVQGEESSWRMASAHERAAAALPFNPALAYGVQAHAAAAAAPPACFLYCISSLSQLLLIFYLASCKARAVCRASIQHQTATFLPLATSLAPVFQMLEWASSLKYFFSSFNLLLSVFITNLFHKLMPCHFHWITPPRTHQIS